MTMPAMPNMPAEEVQRVRDYLIAQANKLSMPELVEKVRKDTLPLKDLAEAAGAATFRKKPAPDDWSAAEVWTHILQMNDHGAAAITGILDSGAVPPRTRDILTGETREGLATARDYYDTYLARREALLSRALEASGDEHLEIKINHPMFGDLSWREWLLFMRVHDLDHARQLQSVAAAVGG
ncbi:MAG: DinB family protein [Dehalococcoidia bacterium]